MILPSDIRDYLAGAGVTASIVDSFETVDVPDRIVHVMPGGGPGLARENHFDRVNVQVLVRGNRGDLEDAVALADQVDRILVDADFPVTIAGAHVPRIQRTGGPPQPIHRDDARRSITSASYVVEIAR